MSDNQPSAAGQDQQFAVQRIYVKDLSFESPLGAMAFTKQWQPQVQVDLNTKTDRIDPDNFEVVLTITITAKVGDETAFLIELQQAGLFFVKGLEGEQLRRVLRVMGANILFPYAREAIDSVVLRGSFPPLLLQPVNFEAIYLQTQQSAQH